MIKTNFLIKIIIGLLLIPVITNGGGWTQPKGASFFILEYRFLKSSKYLDGSGVHKQIPELTDASFNLYGEYGLTEKLTLSLNFPFYKMLNKDVSFRPEIYGNLEERSGVGDLDFGIRYKVYSFGQTVLSAALLFGIPVSKDEESVLPLSDGEFNQLFGFEIGHSFYPANAYLTGEVKFNNRTEGFSDQLYYAVEAGYNLFENLLVNVRLHAIQSLHNGNRQNSESLLLFANNQQFIAYKFGAFYNLMENMGITASFESGIIAYNIQSAPVLTLGLFIKS